MLTVCENPLQWGKGIQKECLVPTPSDPEMLYSLIVEIRKAFNDLKNYSDREIGDLGLTTAMRAVLEDLDSGGAQTVPEIARGKNVTRQHIQQLADALVDGGFAEFRDNPAHRRSKLLVMSEKGAAAFSEIRKREGRALMQACESIEDTQLKSSIATLRTLRRLLGERPVE